MPARLPQRRKITAREAAEKFGVSTRTIRRAAAEPRAEFLARAQLRRDRAVQLRQEGKKHVEIAAIMEIPIGTVSTLLDQARKDGRLPDKTLSPPRSA